MVLLDVCSYIRRATSRVVYGGACLIIVPSTLALVLIDRGVIQASCVPFVAAIGVAGVAVVVYKCVSPDRENSCGRGQTRDTVSAIAGKA